MTMLAQRPAQAETPAEPSPLGPSPMRIALSGFCATAAAAWMAGGLFRGFTARLVGVLAALLGAAIVALSYRTRRPSTIQWLALPVSLLAGLLLVLPSAGGGVDVVGLISEALGAGGLAQPPVPFDPGWRFVIVVLIAIVGAAAAGIGIALDRPKLAVAVPVPLVVGAALIQPPEGELVSSIVAIGLVLAGLAVSYGSELATEGTATGGAFELRRLGRGAALVAVLAVAIVAVSQAGFLFPDTARDRVVPPTRPTVQPPPRDRVLFRAFTPSPGPWRLGVLDVYDGAGWLFPPTDPARMVPVRSEVRDPRYTIQADTGTETVTFTIAGLEGHILPTLPNALSVQDLGGAEYDPRTQGLRLTESRARDGLRYTVTAAKLPTGRALSDAPDPPAWAREFMEAPAPPNEVVTLLRDAPEAPWDRVQTLRAKLYEKVVAAGAGTPTDLLPRRVSDMLAGGDATPWEITAAEALLARWAGMPSRIGFGFYRGERAEGKPFAEVRPRHGATWLEVYAEGHGWVPIVGVPPRARASLSPDQQNDDPNVKPTDELGLIVHIPIRLRSVELFYVTARYWASIAIPLSLALALAWWAFPGFAKLSRRVRRARWARARGPRQRIAAAYAEVRDRATDLGLRAHTLTPIAFTREVESDDEHLELAWLVTRALWGDLARDLRDADAVAAEELARSVGKRLSRGQPGAVRLLSFGARGSLRQPWSAEVPNWWPAWIDRRPVRSFIRARVVHVTRKARARRLARAMSAMLLLLVSCAQGYDPAAVFHPERLPEPVVPASLRGYDLKREPLAEEAYERAGDVALIGDGRVYTIRRGDTIEGYLQAATVDASVDIEDPVVRRAFLGSIAAGRFKLVRIGDERVWSQELPEQRMLAWFTPGGEAMYLQVTRRAFADAGSLFVDIVRAAKGSGSGVEKPVVPEYEPRRGGEA